MRRVSRNAVDICHYISVIAAPRMRRVSRNCCDDCLFQPDFGRASHEARE